MATPAQGSDFYRKYDLADARRNGVAKRPFAHQEEALQKLDRWYKSVPTEPRGGILVLPTGGGKTFTACHFICRNPLSDGFKVLWLAHTHHLLEQAFFSFSELVGLIAEPKAQLHTRVVSGTIGHFPVHSIQASDDIIVSSLPLTPWAKVRRRDARIFSAPWPGCKPTLTASKRGPEQGKPNKKEANMRALSLNPWWVELILLGLKTSDFRSRRTRIRGRVYLYATLGGSTTPEDEEEINDEYGVDLDYPGLPRGVLVGTVEIYDCKELPDGQFEWCLRNPESLQQHRKPTKIPQPGFFTPF